MRNRIGMAGLLAVFMTLGCAPKKPVEKTSFDLYAVGATGIAGQVQASDGSAAEEAVVYAYRNAGRGLRGPADFAAEVAEDGSYFLDLVEGRYYLVARQRHSENSTGPLRAGDFLAPHPNNPIEVRPDYITRADFRLQQVTQRLGFKPATPMAGNTGFVGRLVNPQGHAVSGGTVLAYRSANRHRMPDFISPETDAEGRFTLYLPDPGRYCLVAREHSRGQPKTGDLHLIIEDREGGCHSAVAGQVRDLGTLTLQPYRP